MPAPATISKNISGFDPRSVPGCRLWLDAADTSSTTGTSPVTAWRDKSSFGNNTTSYGGTPAISTSAINGRRTLYFNGSSYFLGAISAASSTTITVIMVASLISPFGGFSGLVCFGNPSQFDYDNVGSLPITMYNDQFKIYGARNSSSQPTPISAGVPFIYVLQYDGTYINTWKNGTIQTDPSTNVASSGTFTYTNYSVACRSGTISGQYPWSGYIGEILVYQSVLTPSQRQSIEGYLAWKWGLETISSRNLVLGHPFYYNTPFSRGFQPIDITNCALWLDAADSSTTGGGSTLTTWLDKSGRENTATSGSGTIAVSSTGLTFNGSTNYMTVAGLAGAIANTSFVIFIVETLTGSSGYYFGDDNVNAGTDSALHIGYRSQTNQTFAFYADDLEDYAISGSNIRRVWTHWLPTGANRVTRRNGAVDVTLGNSNRLLAFTAPRIGRVFGGNYYTGIISEILVYTIDIGIQNILPIEGYLAWKWGLQSSLPATHPYKQFPPSSALPFSPTTISNCQLWMDAAQDTSANNATITTIPDRSANGSNLTAIGTITFYQNFRNGNPVYYFGGNRASNANFNWGTSFTHFVVSSSVNGSWLNSVGSLNTYVGLGNWALVNINSAINFVDPGSITTWSTSGSVTTGVSASGLPFVTLPVSTTSGSATTIYTTPINSVRQTSFSLVLPSTAGLYSYFGLANGTTTLQFLLNTSGGVPSQIYFFFGGNPTLNVVAGSTVFCSITNTSLYMIVYPSGSNVTVSWTNSGAGEYYMYFNVIGNGANANTTTYANIQFDPAQGGSILPKTTGLVNAWNITSIGYTSGSTTLTNYAVNGNPRSSTTSTPHSGQTPVLPLYINGSSGGAYDTSYFAEIIHYNAALSTAQRQQVEGYLAAKWAITLPSTHPYYKFQPSQSTKSSIIASGGTITVSGSTIYNTFTSSGNFVVNGTGQVNYLIVGGGGGGGDRHGGGGGAGGVVSGTFTAVTGTYAVTVGNGGAGGNYEANNSSPQGSGVIGGLSTVSGVNTGYGGGGGGTYDGNPTGTVGSGGGGGGNGYAGVAGTAGQGNAGGSGLQPGAGGGGGAGGAGVNANTGTGGIGTAAYSTQLLAVGYGTTFAVASSPNTVISGGVAYIAGGGGGAAGGSPGPGGTGGLGGGGRGDWDNSYISAGTANTGGGGGGSRSESGGGSAGFAGGSGLVIFWYGI